MDHELGSDDLSHVDPIPELKELEALVTSRLRMASNSWVRRSMLTAIAAGALFVAMAFVSVYEDRTPKILLSIAVVGACLCAIVWSLASVSETFEYDVLLVLNNPMALSRAQRYIGQQMLPHLQHLNWGFRFCGSVINTRAVSAIALTMFSALVGLFGSSMLSWMQ